MTSEQAAAALGVRLPTLYAYVSRGVIDREVAADPNGLRVSRFRREDVLKLARARSRPRAGTWSPLIESDVTRLDASGRLAFRGADVTTCAEWGYERTARHVLGDESSESSEPSEPDMPGEPSAPDKPNAPDRLWLTAPEQPRDPAPGRATDVIRGTVLRLAAEDEQRERTDAAHCRRVAETAITVATAALTGLRQGTVAERLARHWAPETRAGGGALIAAVDTALSVLVDHELTASTLAARAAAGVRADPWMVLLTGLAAMSGPSQAGASAHALAALRAWGRSGTVPEEPVAGFGHKVYTGPDPRAVLLLDRVAAVRPATADAIDELAVAMARKHSLHPNIDIALAGLIVAADLPDDAGDVVFTLARIPGLMAHALEEYPHGLRLRPRALS
ncbi:citrate synthase [Streptomyces sp. NPDC056144]|uniref:citrate synthase n=1 Tax=unclassified Streptomyces TaxID=2593676 RepID=UPI0035D894E5